MGSNSAVFSTAWYCSILMIPLIPMFWVISTALVLQGVIILARGPIKKPKILSWFIHGASKSQDSFSMAGVSRGVLV